MKDQLQKELKEKIKEGVKPSQLKRSRSLGDIPKTPFLPENAPSNKSAEKLKEAYPTKLETKISVLEEQLKEKQTQIENLREQLETNPNPNDLDQSLIARHANLKSWFTQYQKTKKLDSELSENIEYASEELISQDDQISQLRTENIKLKQSNRQLARDLSLSERLAEMRRTPLPSSTNWPSFNLGWFWFLSSIMLAWWFLTWKKYDL